MRDDIIEILCDINPLWDPDDEDMSIAAVSYTHLLLEMVT